MIISSAHRELLAWAARTVCAEPPPVPEPQPQPKTNGAARHRKPARKNGGGDSRLTKRERDDEALLEAMRDSPGASIGSWAAALNESKSSTVTALQRLRDASLAESAEGKWKLTGETPPRAPAPRWVEPVSGSARAMHSHLT